MRAGFGDAPSDAPWTRVLAHPLRVQMLAELVKSDLVSPVELARGLDVPVEIVSYHVRRLEGLGVIKLAKRTPARGAVQHHYRLVDRAATIRALGHATGLAGLSDPHGPPIGSLQDLGRRLRAHREAAGVAVADLAERAGTKRSYLQSIEAGASDPRVGLVLRLASALGISLGELFGETPGAPESGTRSGA